MAIKKDIMKEKIVMERPAVVRDAKVRERLSDIDLLVSWREIANTYFERSASWLYHKFDGIDGNGGAGGFSPEEKEKLRGALFDISRRIRVAAEQI